MDGTDIAKINEEKDLGVLIDCNLKFYSQCLAVVNKANRLLGLIQQTFSNISADSFTCPYKSLLRPILEYVTRSAKRALIAFPIIHVWLIITPNLLKLSPCNYTHSYCQVRVVE